MTLVMEKQLEFANVASLCLSGEHISRVGLISDPLVDCIALDHAELRSLGSDGGRSCSTGSVIPGEGGLVSDGVVSNPVLLLRQIQDCGLSPSDASALAVEYFKCKAAEFAATAPVLQPFVCSGCLSNGTCVSERQPSSRGSRRTARRDEYKVRCDELAASDGMCYLKVVNWSRRFRVAEDLGQNPSVMDFVKRLGPGDLDVDAAGRFFMTTAFGTVGKRRYHVTGEPDVGAEVAGTVCDVLASLLYAFPTLGSVGGVSPASLVPLIPLVGIVGSQVPCCACADVAVPGFGEHVTAVQFSVVPDTVYVQTLLCTEDASANCAKSVAIRKSGGVALPYGSVKLQVYSDGLLSLPRGVYAHLHGDIVGSATVSVSILIRGAAIARFSNGDTMCHRVGGCSGTFGAWYRPVRGGGHLSAWLNDTLDFVGSEARFLRKAGVKVVVLQWPRVGVGYLVSKSLSEGIVSVGITDPLDIWVGTTESRCEVQYVGEPICVVEKGNTDRVVLSKVRTSHGESDVVVINGCLRVGTDSSVAVRGTVEMVLGPNVITSDSPVCDVSYHLEVMVDEYIIDDGGPSDSDGFQSELRECLGGSQTLLASREGRYLSDMSRGELACVKGYSYVRLLSEACYRQVSADLGGFPTLSTLLSLRTYQLVGEDVLTKFRLVKGHFDSLIVMEFRVGDSLVNGWADIYGVGYVMPHTLGDKVVAAVPKLGIIERAAIISVQMVVQ